MDRSKTTLRKYINTLSMIYIEAAYRVLGKTSVYIEYSVNKGLYTEIKDIETFTPELVAQLRKAMEDIIESKQAIEKIEVSREEAIAVFEKQCMLDKVRVLSTGTIPTVPLYRIDKMQYSFLGGVFKNTEEITNFALVPISRGLILVFPHVGNGLNYENQKKLFSIFRESEDWARLMAINNAGDLNLTIQKGEISDIVRICEALHEKKIAYIADQIQTKKTARLILVAGPSSSGKTTFAKRLGIQLRVLGKHYITIGMDDYFVDREQTPLGEDGKPNFDSIGALDIDQFNQDLQRIIRGEKVRLPSFNFISGKREYKKEPIQIDKETYIIVEGIHGLNDALTGSIPADEKFKIYISALTQLNLDNHNRIATTDLRLIRRMVRDIKTRGYNAEKTLEMWTNVVKGENVNIFPYQENADVMFNSSLIYELSFLKRHAVPVLSEIPSDSPYFEEGKRLLTLLQFFNKAGDERAIPNTSIIREFIGGSCFEH
ncbi:MAG: nucleoside kinase [Peptostreptococcaceae bacterium]|nr:nucleoside kinase [Peptostreptococcaceae bacterium]